jgi:hypothetical protein
MGFLAQQILNILSSHIKTEWIFSVASMFTNLQQCHLGVENFDKIIMIYKNWLSDAQLDCKLVDGDKLNNFFVVEDTLLEGNEDLFENASYLEDIEF